MTNPATGAAGVFDEPADGQWSQPPSFPSGAATQGFFGDNGWGFGVSVVTRRTGIAKSPGSYGWNGGLGTAWWNDPAEDLITILMTQQAWPSASPPPDCQDFWTLACQAIDD
jgi:CubicO group peptidase (beta-lactamase class C family)